MATLGNTAEDARTYLIDALFTIPAPVNGRVRLSRRASDALQRPGL